MFRKGDIVGIDLGGNRFKVLVLSNSINNLFKGKIIEYDESISSTFYLGVVKPDFLCDCFHIVTPVSDFEDKLKEFEQSLDKLEKCIRKEKSSK